MISRKFESLESFHGDEGSVIREIFQPENTLNGIRFSLAHSVISPGNSSKLHTLKNAEIIFVLEGNGIIYVNGQSEKIKKNQSVYIPPLSKQYLKNTGHVDLKILCIVDPAWKSDAEILD